MFDIIGVVTFVVVTFLLVVFVVVVLFVVVGVVIFAIVVFVVFTVGVVMFVTVMLLMVIFADDIAFEYLVIKDDVAVFIMLPSKSLLYCQYITPAYQPNYVKARDVQLPSSVALTNPEFMTSLALAGFPTTILFEGIPRAIISLTEVPLKKPVA